MKVIDFGDRYKTEVPTGQEPICIRCLCPLDYSVEDLYLWGRDLLNVRLGTCPMCDYTEMTIPVRQGAK